VYDAFLGLGMTTYLASFQVSIKASYQKRVLKRWGRAVSRALWNWVISW
jgi:hypothetical protein